MKKDMKSYTCLAMAFSCLLGQTWVFGFPGELSNSELTIDQVGPVPLPLAISGSTLFAFRNELIKGTLKHQQYPIGVVQLLMRTQAGWVATAATTSIACKSGSKPVNWAIPVSSLSCNRESRDPIEIVAIYSRRHLPTGSIQGISWPQMVRSAPVFIACEQFEDSHLSVVKVGNTLVKPNNPPRVSQYEDIHVQVDNLPQGSIIQICISPVQDAKVWCQDGAHPFVGNPWVGPAYLGRPELRSGPDGMEFVDSYSRYWVRAMVVRKPLPIIPGGISPHEWLLLKPLILKESDPVEVIKAYRPSQVRVLITDFGGDVTDGRVKLVYPVSRVTGEFQPLPGYRRNRLEIVTLLVRSLNDKTWSVAGAAVIQRDLTLWLLTAADLNPQNQSLDSDRLAIAVVSHKFFPDGQPVTEELLRQEATSISDELRFRFFNRR